MGSADGDCLNVAVADELDHALLCDLVIFDNEQTLDVAADKAFEFPKDLAQLLRSGRLVLVSHGAHLEAALTFFVDGQDMDGDMPGRPRMLQAVQDAPTIHSRQFDIKRDRAGCVLPCKSQACLAAQCHENLELTLAGHLHHDLCEIEVVFND